MPETTAPAAPPAGPRTGKPVPQPDKRTVVHGLLVGAVLGGIFAAVNLAVGAVPPAVAAAAEKPAPGSPEQTGAANWHAAAARYTGKLVCVGGVLGLLTGGAAVMQHRYRRGPAA